MGAESVRAALCRRVLLLLGLYKCTRPDNLAVHGVVPFLSLALLLTVVLLVALPVRVISHARAVEVATRVERLLLLGPLLDLGRHRTEFRRGELLEDCPKLVVLVDVPKKHLIIDVLGASPERFFL